MNIPDKNAARAVAEASSCNAMAATELAPAQQGALRACVEATLDEYFAHLDGYATTDLYALVLREIEAPLLAAVMRHTDNNQCAAAQLLGLNRGTLRKKLKQYDLL